MLLHEKAVELMIEAERSAQDAQFQVIHFIFCFILMYLKERCSKTPDFQAKDMLRHAEATLNDEKKKKKKDVERIAKADERVRRCLSHAKAANELRVWFWHQILS